MIRLSVPDLEAWWQAVSRRQLQRAYPTLRITPPTEFPWGRQVHLIDLAGVCWHVGQGDAAGGETRDTPASDT